MKKLLSDIPRKDRDTRGAEMLLVAGALLLVIVYLAMTRGGEDASLPPHAENSHQIESSKDFGVSIPEIELEPIQPVPTSIYPLTLPKCDSLYTEGEWSDAIEYKCDQLLDRGTQVTLENAFEQEQHNGAYFAAKATYEAWQAAAPPATPSPPMQWLPNPEMGQLVINTIGSGLKDNGSWAIRQSRYEQKHGAPPWSMHHDALQHSGNCGTACNVPGMGQLTIKWQYNNATGRYERVDQ